VERIELTDSDNFRTYFTKLRVEASGEELQTLTNLMTVNETYFFVRSTSSSVWSIPCFPILSVASADGSPIRIWAISFFFGRRALFHRHLSAGVLGWQSMTGT